MKSGELPQNPATKAPSGWDYLYEETPAHLETRPLSPLEGNMALLRLNNYEISDTSEHQKRRDELIAEQQRVVQLGKTEVDRLIKILDKKQQNEELSDTEESALDRLDGLKGYLFDRQAQNESFLGQAGRNGDLFIPVYRMALEDNPLLAAVQLMDIPGGSKDDRAFFRLYEDDGTSAVHFNFTNPDIYVHEEAPERLCAASSLIGVNPEEFAANKELLASYIFLHELGHAQDYLYGRVVPLFNYAKTQPDVSGARAAELAVYANIKASCTMHDKIKTRANMLSEGIRKQLGEEGADILARKLCETEQDYGAENKATIHRNIYRKSAQEYWADAQAARTLKKLAFAKDADLSAEKLALRDRLFGHFTLLNMSSSYEVRNNYAATGLYAGRGVGVAYLDDEYMQSSGQPDRLEKIKRSKGFIEDSIRIGEKLKLTSKNFKEEPAQELMNPDLCGQHRVSKIICHPNIHFEDSDGASGIYQDRYEIILDNGNCVMLELNGERPKYVKISAEDFLKAHGMKPDQKQKAALLCADSKIYINDKDTEHVDYSSAYGGYCELLSAKNISGNYTLLVQRDASDPKFKNLKARDICNATRFFRKGNEYYIEEQKHRLDKDTGQSVVEQALLFRYVKLDED